MKNILTIIRHDLKKITGSVVAIITIMGLCIVPCSYAWFNIFSNWSPYESDATGRISVAVANADEGTKAAGLSVNVGDKIVEALKANNDIGWVFVDSESEAREGVFAGDYYAALIVPEGFSRDVLSFMDGNLINPKLVYYENEKKNAIAPKITGKAKTAVQEEVNAAFVETLASYVSDAASIAEATGTDPAQMLSDLSDKIDRLSMDMNSAIVLANSAATLTAAGGNLLGVSDTLIGSTQGVLEANDEMLDAAQRNLPDTITDTTARDESYTTAKEIDNSLKELRKKTDVMLKGDENAFINFVINERDTWIESLSSMQQAAAAHEEPLKSSEYTVLADEFRRLAARLGEISKDLSTLDTGMTPLRRERALLLLDEDLDVAEKLDALIKVQIKGDIDTDLANALAKTKRSINAFRVSLSGANSDLSKLSSTMRKYQNSVENLQSSVEGTASSLKAIQRDAGEVSDVLSGAAGSELLKTLSDVLANDETAVAEYLANPIKMDKETIWPVETYGSAMASFYTVLAQWVGALLTSVLIKVKIRKTGALERLRLHEWYFGRFGLYLFVGIAQALIVSLGDLLYVKIQCQHPLLFVLAACVNGLVFMLINYGLVFALDNIGLGAAVIILVLQVAGAGGTYPIEVLPGIFKTLYPLMPFRYSMDAMRECIAGMYGDTYQNCIFILLGFGLFFTAFGIALYKPMLWLNNMISESKAKSEIML